jgi:hypothetical protein
MAQVIQDADLRARIDGYLHYLVETWQGVPMLAAEWGDWDEHSRLVFALDWPVCEDRLHQLRQWAAEGRLTAPQRRQYDDLLALERRHRPTLERLLAG